MARKTLAKSFLFLACVIIFTCMLPRTSLALFSAPSVNATALLAQPEQVVSGDDTPCSLAEKSVFSSVLHALSDIQLFTIEIVLLVLALMCLLSRYLSFIEPQTFVPRLRLHLRLCVFRE